MPRIFQDIYLSQFFHGKSSLVIPMNTYKLDETIYIKISNYNLDITRFLGNQEHLSFWLIHNSLVSTRNKLWLAIFKY